MDRTSELQAILGEILNWNKARLDCFSKMLLAMFAVRTVNLKEIAVGFAGSAQVDSRYKRLKRFFAQCTIDSSVIAGWLFKLFFKGDQKLYLTVDRTNWFFGKAKINILMLAVAYEGLAIPLFWQMLDKGGNATAQEHQSIIQRFVDRFGSACIAGVLADREFASGELFSWFSRYKIPFYIRIKNKTHIRVLRSKPWLAERLFNHLQRNEQEAYVNYVIIYGVTCRIVGSRSSAGELMLVATNADPRNGISIYLRRWEIENLFQGLKSRGFRFEETHMQKLVRIDKLLSLLAIGFCWAHKVGEWRALKKPIVFNIYRTSRRPQYTYFRYGFDWIRELVLHGKGKATQWRQCLAQIAIPNPLILENL